MNVKSFCYECHQIALLAYKRAVHEVGDEYVTMYFTCENCDSNITYNVKAESFYHDRFDSIRIEEEA